MSREYNACIGSGQIPHIAHGPVHDIPQGYFPVPDQRNSLRTRQGEGAIILNPEDFSISIDLRQQAISVGGTATALPLNPLEFRRALVLHNNGPGILYVGLPNVTTINGFPLAVSEKMAIDCLGTPNVTLWGVSESTSDIRLLELS